MAKTATSSIELEPIDRLEEKVKRLIGIVERMKSDQARAAEENQRLQMYKRVARIETDAQLSDLGSELADRYGEPPQSVRNLLDYAALKLICTRMGVAAIERKRELVNIKFTDRATVDPERLAKFVSSQRGAQFTPGGTLKFEVKTHQAEEVLAKIQEVLEELAAAPAEQSSSVES